MVSDDLILDDNDNLTIANGDLVIGQSDDQNVEAIILAEKGQFYESPLLGYGITRRANGPFDKQRQRQLIRAELKRDNYKIVQLDIDDNFTVTIQAEKVK